VSDHNPAPTVIDDNDRNIFDSSTDLELLNKSMDEVARQIGGMELDDPTRSDLLIEELCGLGQLRASLESERNKLINQRMGQLAHEVGTLKPDDPRRAQLVGQILRLNDLLSTK